MKSGGRAIDQLILSTLVARRAGYEMQRTERRSAGVVHFKNATGGVVFDLRDRERAAKIDDVARMEVQNLAAKAGGIVDLKRVCHPVAEKIQRVVSDAIGVIGDVDLDLAAIGDLNDAQLRRIGLSPVNALPLNDDAAAVGVDEPRVDELRRGPREAGMLRVLGIAA